MTSLSTKTTGTLIMVLAVLVLSPDALLISLVKADPWVLVFWRGLLTASTLAGALIFAHGRRVWRVGRGIGLPGIVAGVFFGMSTVAFVLSVRMTTAANTLVIIAAMPLFAAIMTRIFLGERIPARTWVAVLAGLAGIGVIFKGSMSAGSLVGDLLAMITAILMAANFVIIRKYRDVTMVPAVVLSGVLTTVATSLISAPLSVTAGDFLFLTAMGTVVLPVPLALMTVAPKLIAPAEVSLIMLLETFLGPYWVWLAIGQRPGKETVVGGGLLVATVAWHALAGWREVPDQVPD